MKVDKNNLQTRMRRKALKSACNYRVVAVGLDRNGNVLGISTNLPRPLQGRTDNNFRCTWHAEERLIYSLPRNLDTIYIARFGKSGLARPIDPCKKCKELADKRGIKIKRFI